MRFGCCARIEDVAAVEAAGYDYVELPVVAVQAEKPESEFVPVAAALALRSIRPEAWNVLLPGDLRVTGPDVDFYRVRRYLHTAFERVQRLGGQVVVFGSGKARSFPEGFDPCEVHSQLLEFLEAAAEAAGEYGLILAIEPLNKKESNVINTVSEAVDLAAEVGRPQIRVLADLYHIDEESESLQNVADAGLWLAHTHTADTGRFRPGSGSYDHHAFFRALAEAGYDGRMSVECRWNDFRSECAAALEFLRRVEAECRQ